MKKQKKVVKPLSPAQIKSRQIATYIQLSILLCLLLLILVDSFFSLHVPMVFCLAIFVGSFLVKWLASKYIIPFVLRRKEGAKIE